MSIAVGILNLLLGAAYTGYGVLTLIDMRRGWRRDGFSHFGAAWVAMAFTCGPHHLFHGIHILAEGRQSAVLDLVAVLVGLPFAVTWLLLRIEAVRGGRGDRFIAGTPGWMYLAPTLAGSYGTALIAGALTAGPVRVAVPSMMAPNLLLVGLYFTIGYFLIRTQLRHRATVGGWSVSGCSLAVVFPTCALMHGVWVLYAATGLYHFDIHGFAIDWLAVPAAVYFLWVVRSLHRGLLRDWNQTMGADVPQGAGA
ncbi:MAG: hypothetical protein ACRDJO_01910 [Actinomycetota bacterium]